MTDMEVRITDAGKAEWSAFLDAHREAERQRDARGEKLRRRYVTDRDALRAAGLPSITAWNTQQDANNASWQKFDDAMNAPQEFLRQSKDPLIAAIAVPYDMRDYVTEIDEVISVLPSTMQRLNDMAYANGWCGEWRDRRDAVMDRITETEKQKRAFDSRI